MEAQKIISLIEESDEYTLKFQTRKWYIINDQNNSVIYLNNEHVETAENLNLTTSFHQVPYGNSKQEQPLNAAGNIDNDNSNNSSLFK